MESINKIFDNSYGNATKLKGDRYEFSTKIEVDIHFQEYLFDLYDVNSIDYRSMRNLLESELETNEVLIDIKDKFGSKVVSAEVVLERRNATRRKKADKDGSLYVPAKMSEVEAKIIIPKMTEENVNYVFDTIYLFYVSDINKRKFFNVSYLLIVICEMFGLDAFVFGNGLSEKNKKIILSNL